MASIELTVAYPGREGAHSAAACDRLFPAARLVPLPTFSDVDRRGRRGTRAVRRPPDRELARRPGERDARPALRVAALDRGRGDPADQPLPRRPGARRARRTCARSARIPVALDQCRRLIASLPRTHSPSPRRRRATRPRPWRRSPTRRCRDRKRASGADVRPDDHRRQRRRPSRGVHALRLGGALHAARPAGRELAHGILLHDRSPPGSAASTRSSRSPATRSTSTCSSRGRSPRGRSATGSTPSQRPPARPRDLRHAPGDAAT